MFHLSEASFYLQTPLLCRIKMLGLAANWICIRKGY